MAYKTMQALITDVEKAIYQSAGPGVQIYSQDVIMQKLQMGFEHCFSHKFWPQFRKREVRALNGTTGLITVLLTYIKQWDDIQYVFRRNSDRPLPDLPVSFNTLDFTGTTAQFKEAHDTHILKIWPETATDNIVVIGRNRPSADFGLQDQVLFDPLALTHFATWSYFTDDESNAASAEKHRGLFESRMSALERDAFGNSVLLNPRAGYIPTQWNERP